MDEEDNDLIRFLTYFISALQTIKMDIGTKILAVLQSLRQAQPESVLTALLNEINAMPDDFILVLDDYHAIDAKPVDDALAFLLEHSTLRMHLVIATRKEPNLPLAKLRADGQLTELRASDLRFTASEAAEFFNQVMGLNLSEKNITTLEIRTEGWIAGLKMAALSMRGRRDASGFIQAFSGSHRFVLDYLLEEVLQRQTGRMRDFLLQTAILDGLCGSLCDAVTGRDDGGAMLEAMERGNLFIVPLDDKRQWYRYHRLFADVLRAHLLKVQPELVSMLHRRASGWYEQNRRPRDAIFHALTGCDFERAAGLIELAGPAMEGNPQAATWLGWVKALPDKLIRARPVLSVWYAYALLAVGPEIENAKSRLIDAEQCLANPSTGIVVVDEGQFRSLPATIAVARAYLAQSLGDVAGTVKYARQGLSLIAEGNNLRREQAAGLLGMACWSSGDLDEAGRIFTDYNAKLRAARNVPDACGTAFVLAEIHVSQGRLRDAAATLEQSLQFAMDRGEPLPPDAADLHRVLGELYREWGDLETAARHLSRGAALGSQGELFGWKYRLCVAQAIMKQVQGDMAGAIDLLYEAERMYVSIPLPVVRPISAIKARIWLMQDKHAEALGWARERSLSVVDDLSYLREFEYVTLARVLIARYRNKHDDSIQEAMRLLERLLKAAEESGRNGSVIEILMLQALAREALGDIAFALAPLQRALTLAEPEGYLRIFADEGSCMERLLKSMASSCKNESPSINAYIHTLLASLEKQASSKLRLGMPLSPPPGERKPIDDHTVEFTVPLSQRELEVLGLISRGLSNREIGERLFLALDTIKGCNRRIFDKLDVKRRTEAIARARELGLL